MTRSRLDSHVNVNVYRPAMSESSRENRDHTLAVLGLGPMGRALAAAAAGDGRRLVIWNRTADKAADLVTRGATLAPTPAAAVHRASTVVCCVLNYDVVRDVLRTVPDWDATTLINLTSGHPGEARALAAWAGERGVSYLDGAILTPAPTIGTPAASILYSGSRTVFDRTSALLTLLSGTTQFLGEDPGAAAGFEMALLDLFTTAVGGLAHAFSLARAESIAPSTFAPFAQGIGGLLAELTTRFADQLEANHFPGTTSNIASASSAIAHVIEAAARHDIDVSLLRALQSVTDRALANGYGNNGYARLTHVIGLPAALAE
ncbi:NAD(P)-dependent oxidoreductase [Cryptosporangium sp. NPDC051539]|uniref:NAD(P)-dependent oxidoreductase n=1 Tax=Cryptosporangium sp. NPDC051539 TaxID=3363962 RepID=UPI0037A52FD3